MQKVENRTPESLKNSMFYVCFARAAKTVKRHKYLSNGAAISTPF